MSNMRRSLTGKTARLACLAGATVLLALLSVSSAIAAPAAAPAQAMAPGMMMSGPKSPDFPPGSFSDYGHYSLEDFHGKLLVLFFYEKDCPTCRGLIPTRNAVVDKFKNAPVKFIAVGPNDSMNDVISYQKGTRLEMTTFADTLGVMEARYGFHISLQNIYQFRYIGPNGNVIDQGIELTPELVENALKTVKWKYKDGGYDPQLNHAIELLEWNQYAAGMTVLRPWLKNKATAESAKKLYDAVKEEGKQWLDQAEQAKSTEPAQAYDLYSRVSTAFVGDDLAKSADEALKTLKMDQAVKDELDARQMYAPLYNVMTKAKPTNRAEVAQYCLSISTKYPNSPTGKKAAQLAQDLQNEDNFAPVKK